MDPVNYERLLLAQLFHVGQEVCEDFIGFLYFHCLLLVSGGKHKSLHLDPYSFIFIFLALICRDHEISNGQ